MLSRAVYIISVAVMCYASFFFFPRWKNSGAETVIAWDVSGYYWYLPSVFIYKDLKHQTFKDSILKKYAPTNNDFQQGMLLENGNYVMKYSSGMAIMYLPFFTAAHILAKPLGYPADGFSTPYQVSIQLGGFLISVIGLWYLRKLLLRFYSDKVVAVVLLLLAIGSNYLNYAAIDTGMSHCWLFTIYVFLLLNTCYFYESFKIKYAIRIGLLIGLATLIRPTEIISCIIPILWGMENISITAIKARINLIGNNIKAMLLAGACAVLIISIQLVYWKYVSGHWLVYSYGNLGFSWMHPHIMIYAFNYKCGWLTYAPMLMLAIVGIVPFLKNGNNKIAILLFILINYYVVSAWDIWWYGGRAMVQSYAVLAFPLAALVSVVLDRKILLTLFIPVALVFLYFNIWIIWHYHKGDLYDPDRMTKEYYWRVAGRWNVPKATIVLRDNKYLYEDIPKQMQLVYSNDFEQDIAMKKNPSTINGAASLILDKNHQLSPVFSFSYNDRNAQWLRAQATFRCKDKEGDVWKMTQFIVRLTDKNKTGDQHIVNESMMRVYRLLNDNETKVISLDIKLPQVPYDSVSVSFWNGGSDQPIFIDDLKVWSFNE